MADDLVVREFAEEIASDEGLSHMPEYALARAYLERDAQLAEANALIDSSRHAWEMTRRGRDDLLAQLAAMTAERDAWKGAFDNMTLVAAENMSKLTASEAARGKLRKALRTYGRHRKGCTQTIEQISEYACTCGFSASLAEPGKAGEP